MSSIANVKDLMAQGEGHVITPMQGILFHGESKSGGDFWALKDNDGNTIYVKFWSCTPPHIPLKGEKIVTFTPELKTGKGGGTNSNIKLTVYNGKSGLNINKGYKFELDGPPPEQDSRQETASTTYTPQTPSNTASMSGDSAASKTRQNAAYWLLCRNTALTMSADMDLPDAQFQAFVSSLYIQGSRDDLHKMMPIPDEKIDF